MFKPSKTDIEGPPCVDVFLLAAIQALISWFDGMNVGLYPLAKITYAHLGKNAQTINMHGKPWQTTANHDGKAKLAAATSTSRIDLS